MNKAKKIHRILCGFTLLLFFYLNILLPTFIVHVPPPETLAVKLIFPPDTEVLNVSPVVDPPKSGVE